MRKWLLDKRNMAALTQDEVASRSSINRSHYAKIESGDRRPSPQVAKRIANTLDFDWNLFYPDEDIETSTEKAPA